MPPDPNAESTTEPIEFSTLAATYERVRQKISHEDDLKNQRLGWMLNTQGFFMIALGAFSAVGAQSLPTKYTFIAIISALEFAISIFSWIAVRASSDTIDETMGWWKGYRTRHGFIDDKDILPPLINPTEASKWSDARFAEHGIPLTSAIIWGLILVASVIALLVGTGQGNAG